MYNEFIESFFTGYDAYSIKELKLEKGRYAKVANNGYEFTLSLANFFPISQATPFHHKLPPKNVYSTFLQPNSKDVYDMTLDEIISSGELGDVYVVKFTPKEKVKDKLVVSGRLFVRQGDLSIVKFEGELTNLRLTNVKAKDTKVLISINYLERDNDYPIVESVKCNAQLGIIHQDVEHKVNIHSTMFVVDNPAESIGKKTGKKMKDDYSLIDVISKTAYDPAFWQNNPIVKRTAVEEDIIKMFENKNVFGNFQLE